MARRPKQPANDKRISELQSEIENIAFAIAGGALRGSKTLAGRLAAAEAELERLLSEQVAHRKVTRMPAPIGDRLRRLIGNLEAELTRDVHVRS